MDGKYSAQGWVHSASSKTCHRHGSEPASDGQRRCLPPILGHERLHLSQLRRQHGVTLLALQQVVHVRR